MHWAARGMEWGIQSRHLWYLWTASVRQLPALAENWIYMVPCDLTFLDLPVMYLRSQSFFFFLCLSTKYNHFYSMTSCLSICEVNFLQLKADTIIVPQIYPRPLVLAGREGDATSKDTSRLVVRVPANLLLWSILFGPASWFYPIQFVLLQAWVWWMIARKKTLHRSDIQIVTNTHIYSLQHWMLRLSSLRLGSIKISLLKRINHNGQKLIVWWSMLC